MTTAPATDHPSAPPGAITLRKLAPSLFLIILSALLAAGAIAWTLLQHDAALRQLKQAQSRQAEVRARLSRAHDEERETREKIARYQAILAGGYTLPEQRLHWVETLKAIKDTRRLLGLSYEIAPQLPLDIQSPASGGFDFLTSRMKLELPLLHEEDLLGVLEDLSANVQSLIRVRQCQIERTVPATASGANLKAHCEIDWIKLQEKK